MSNTVHNDFDMEETCVSNYTESIPDKISSSHIPPQGREICSPNSSQSASQSSLKAHKSISFEEGTRFVSRHDVDRIKHFWTRHESLKQEKKDNKGWYIVVPRAWSNELLVRPCIFEDAAPPGPPPPTAELSLTPPVEPASLRPSAADGRYVRPTRRPRPSKHRKVVISPTSMAEPPSRSPIPPLLPPNPPPLPPLPPPILSNSFDISLVSPSSSSVSTSSVPCQLSATAVTFVPAAVKAKKSSYFEQFAVVRKVIEEAMSKRTFSFSQFRRHQRQSTMFVNDSAVPTPASSMKVREMFDAEFCGCGDEPLPEIETALNLDSMDKYHVMSCVDCSTEGKILDECYWSKLRRCIPCGFKPPLIPGSNGIPIPLYDANGTEGNHASASTSFPLYTKTQVDKLLARGAVEKCAPEDISVYSPLGVNVPSSRRRQTRTLTSIDARTDGSYEAAEAMLEAQGRSKVLKRRLIFDMKGSGFNDECAYLPFQYVKIDDAIELVSKDCYFAICDCDSYYYHFKMANEFRPFLGFVLDGQCYRFTTLPFGLSPAPRLASTITAENVQSINAQGAPCVAMIDDYLTVGRDIEEALRNQRIMESTLTDNGFILSEPKRVGPVQQAVFTGVLLDSVNMTQSVNPAAADLFKNSLLVYIEIIEQGGELSVDVTRHMCGVLENWAQLCQEGRDRASSCWQYLCHGPALWPACRLHLLDDLRWWLEKAELWATGDADGCYPLITGAYLSEHPDAIRTSVTDFSGIHGLGGVTGSLTDSNPRYFSICQDDSMRGVSSFDGELMALRHVLREEEALSLKASAAGVQPSSVPVLVELWVTDSASAAFSINSGRCKEESGRVLLREIFSIAARLRRTLVALWIPREENSTSDKLSHYAHLLGVSQIQGHVADLPSCVTGGRIVEAGGQGCGEAHRVQTEHEGGEGALRQVQCFPAALPLGNGIRGSGNVPDPVHEGQQGPHGIAWGGSQSFADPARQEQSAIPVDPGQYPYQAAYCPLPQGGPYFDSSGLSVAYSHRAGDHQDNGSERPGAAYQGNPIAYGSPVPSPCWGNHQFPPGGGFYLQDQRACGGYPHPSHQNLYDWGGGIRGIVGQRQRYFSVQTPSAAVCHATSPQEPWGVRILHDQKWATVSRQTLVEGRLRRID